MVGPFSSIGYVTSINRIPNVILWTTESCVSHCIIFLSVDNKFNTLQISGILY